MVTLTLPVGWSTDGAPNLDVALNGVTFYYELILRNLITGTVEGDTDGDGDVDDDDLTTFQAQFGLKTPGNSADFDGDDDVDLDDFVILRANFGTGVGPAPSSPDFSSTPEPATMSLLALGGLLVVRRRRRKA